MLGACVILLGPRKRVWSAIPGENPGKEGEKFGQLGIEAVLARNSGKGLIVPWEQRLCMILSRRGY